MFYEFGVPALARGKGINRAVTPKLPEINLLALYLDGNLDGLDETRHGTVNCVRRRVS